MFSEFTKYPPSFTQTDLCGRTQPEMTDTSFIMVKLIYVICDLDIDCNAREVLRVGRLKQNVRCGFNAEEHKARSD